MPMTHATASSAPPTPSASYPTESPRASWRGMFAELRREHGWEPLRVEGTLPPALRGTLFRNGPALSGVGGQRYGHLFDGDGAVTGVRIRDGGASGAVRVVQSAGLQAERRLGRRIYGAYGTPLPGPLARLGLRLRGLPRGKQMANTSVLAWQGRLFALCEAGPPTELDPDTLATLGETDLDGAVLSTFSAHPHWVPDRQRLYNFGVRYGRQTLLDLYELPLGEGPARRLASVPLAGPTMVHDFIVTERHLVFFAPPLRLGNIPALLLGRQSYERLLRWRPELGTEILVVPIDDPGRPVRFTVEPFYQWHFANAFERGGEIVVDYVRYPDFETNDALRELPSPDAPVSAALARDGRLHRAVLDPARGRMRSEAVSDVTCDFPRVAPDRDARPHALVHLAVRSRVQPATGAWYDGLAIAHPERGTLDAIPLGPEQFPSEPVFAPAPAAKDERDGWVLALVYDGRTHTSHVAVVDARRPGDGPVARLHFDHHIPGTFHGTWVPAAH